MIEPPNLRKDGTTPNQNMGGSIAIDQIEDKNGSSPTCRFPGRPTRSLNVSVVQNGICPLRVTAGFSQPSVGIE